MLDRGIVRSDLLNVRLPLRADSDETIAIGSDGWIFWSRSCGPDVRLRCSTTQEGRIVVTGLCIDADANEPIQAVHLRQLPLGAVEVLLNDLAITDGPAPAQAPAFDPCRVDRVHASTAADSLPIYNPGSDLTIEGAKSRAKPDGFYEQVARSYAAGRRLSRNPVTLIAEANKVPETTVRRWIREARSRGVMAPGRK